MVPQALLTHSAAARLFVERARAVNRAVGIDSRSALAIAVERSLQLLSAAERQLFEELSVFTGAFPKIHPGRL
jgi:hypothetical protein